MRRSVVRGVYRILNDSNHKRSSIELLKYRVFVKSIGLVNIDSYEAKREILLVAVTDNIVNHGMILILLNKYGEKIRLAIERNGAIKPLLKMKESDYKKQLRSLKKSGIFKSNKFTALS